MAVTTRSFNEVKKDDFITKRMLVLLKEDLAYVAGSKLNIY